MKLSKKIETISYNDFDFFVIVAYFHPKNFFLQFTQKTLSLPPKTLDRSVWQKNLIQRLLATRINIIWWTLPTR